MSIIVGRSVIVPEFYSWEVKPPERLSEAILMALHDLVDAEEDPSLDVNMGAWHQPYFRETKEFCYVCFAGAVMAKTLKTPVNESVTPGNFSERWERTFNALDSIRIGEVDHALRHFYGNRIQYSVYETFHNFSIGFFLEELDYRKSPEEFKNAMIDVAAMLESMGY